MASVTPSTPASKIEKTYVSTPGGSRSRKEKILVTVRLRPLSKKEQSQKDPVAWECIDDNTIVLKSFSHDRSNSSAQYTFGKDHALGQLVLLREVQVVLLLVLLVMVITGDSIGSKLCWVFFSLSSFRQNIWSFMSI